MALNTLDRRVPPLFRQGYSLLSKFVFFAAFAIFLMVADGRFAFAQPLRMALSALMSPLQSLASSPVVLARNAQKYFADLEAAQAQAAQAQDDLAALALHKGQNLQMQQENATLRTLLALREQRFPKSLGAEVLYDTADPYSRKILVNKGELDGVELGSPALDAGGIVGQVTRVYLHSAEVSLLISQAYTIPVRNQRTNVSSVAYGVPTVGGGRLELKYLPSNADVQVGDTLITSGLDGVYPRDLQVAIVESVDRRGDATFARVYCKPAAKMTTSHLLLIAPVGMAGIDIRAMENLKAKPKVEAIKLKRAPGGGTR